MRTYAAWSKSMDLTKDDKEIPLEPFPQNSQNPIKCSRCQGLGHKSNNCPKRREVRICEYQTEITQSEEEGVELYEMEQPPHAGDHLSCVIDRVYLTPKSENCQK